MDIYVIGIYVGRSFEVHNRFIQGESCCVQFDMKIDHLLKSLIAISTTIKVDLDEFYSEVLYIYTQDYFIYATWHARL
jgi:hypothetical protein